MNKEEKKLIHNNTYSQIIKFCVFAGREKNICILHKYIEESLLQNIINEYHIFDLSHNLIDSTYLLDEYNRLSSLYKNRIFIHNHSENKILLMNESKNIGRNDWSPFYSIISKESFYENSVIIKCDDDILFIDIIGLKNAIQDRINDKYSFLIHSNCINNNICTFYQKDKFAHLTKYLEKYPKGGILGILFENPKIAYSIHDYFLENCLQKIDNLYNFIVDDVYINTRISINFILINGEDCKYFENTKYDDEYELSSYFPEKLMRPNKIKGDFITSHYSYALQEKTLNMNNNLMLKYNKLLSNYLNNYQTIQFNKNNTILHKFQSNYMFDSSQNKEFIQILNFQDTNLHYIKNNETNQYLYIDYEDDSISLHNQKKTLFQIEEIEQNKIQIHLGIYSFTKYNLQNDFKNKTVLIKNLHNSSEKNILIMNKDNKKYLTFNKSKIFIGINNNKLSLCNNYSYSWTFEKYDSSNKFINTERIEKNKKFYYKNIDTRSNSNNELNTNFYMGWGCENILY